MVHVMFRHFRRLFVGMSSNVRAFKVVSLHNNSHQRETIYDKLIFFAKLEDSESQKSEQNLGQNTTKNHSLQFKIKRHLLKCSTSGLIPMGKPSKISINTFAILPYYQKKKNTQTWMVILSSL